MVFALPLFMSIFCCYPLSSVGNGTTRRYYVRMRLIGIPLGVQAFKMAGLTLTPFGKTVVYGGGVGSVLANIVWFVLAGVWMAIGYVFAGLLNCVTIIGIPFGIQSFKMAKLALWPFGSQIRSL